MSTKTKQQSFCNDCLDIKTCSIKPSEFELINCTDKFTETMKNAKAEATSEEEVTV